MSKPVKQKRTARGAEERSDRLRKGLPKSVLEVRAGLIPSFKTVRNPPAEGLTAAEIIAWHHELPVQMETVQRRY
jgi:hypothetical protein